MPQIELKAQIYRGSVTRLLDSVIFSRNKHISARTSRNFKIRDILVRVNFRKLPSLCCFSAKHCEKNPECGTKSHMKLTCRDKVAEYSEIQ